MNNGFAGVLHHRNQPLMDDSAVSSIGFSMTSYTSGSHGQSQIAFGLDRLGSAMDSSYSHGQRGCRRSSHAPAQDDGCRLVLGLGPTPDPNNSADQHPAGSDKSSAPVTLFGQSFSFTDPGVLSLGGVHQGHNAGARAIHQHTEIPTGHIISFGAVDEGSTSARRSSGGYMPSLVLAPHPNYSAADPDAANGLVVDHTDNISYDSSNVRDHSNGFRLSPEPSASLTEVSFGVSSDVVTAATATASNPGQQQQGHRRHPKKCRFKGCSKGARGSSGLCIAHGGGQRCQKPGCHKGAESRTAYCKAHGGGRRCAQLGCTKSAEGKTDHCIAHGGGRRCGHAGCPKAARGKSGRCIKHGGGKRCSVEGCIRSAEGRVGLCISHGGGRRCQFPDCRKGAQGSTLYCKAHGGGKRCVFEGCLRGAEGSTPLCKSHGAVRVRGRRRVPQERPRRHGVLRRARRRQALRRGRVRQERAREDGPVRQARRRQAVRRGRVREERAGEHRVLQGARRREALRLRRWRRRRRRVREVRARPERALRGARHAGGLAAEAALRRRRRRGFDRAGALPRHRHVGQQGEGALVVGGEHGVGRGRLAGGWEAGADPSPGAGSPLHEVLGAAAGEEQRGRGGRRPRGEGARRWPPVVAWRELPERRRRRQALRGGCRGALEAPFLYKFYTALFSS
ncbi:unnamed protein product [Urochloa humidicola]